MRREGRAQEETYGNITFAGNGKLLALLGLDTFQNGNLGCGQFELSQICQQRGRLELQQRVPSLAVPEIALSAQEIAENFNCDSYLP